MEQVQCVVVGAGVVGLAVARALAQRGLEVWVLEREAQFGTGISARSSEVIHAGMYYTPGSAKARLCRRGRALLLEYCAQRGIAHRMLGKLIVATAPEQLGALRQIADRAVANGIDDLRWLDATQAQALEPALRCHAALHSPGTGIVDSHGLMLALLGDLEAHGGTLVCHTQVTRIDVRGPHRVLYTADGTPLAFDRLVNAAGLDALRLRHACLGLPVPGVVGGLSLPAQLLYAKGNYFGVSGRVPFSRLIYPVPEPGGLGIHLTLDLGGQARFGPDVQWVERDDDWTVDAARAPAFAQAIRRYWPGLPEGALSPAYAGIRPKLTGPDAPAADFVIETEQHHGVRGLVNLLGIESPGLTSALAMAEQVADTLTDRY
ncbi:MAG: NAD(P)/FAD-dependent oxidoreductase [Rhodoferax sp.]